MDGRFGVRPLSSDFDVLIGHHDRSVALRDLDFGDHALAQVSFERTVTYGTGGQSNEDGRKGSRPRWPGASGPAPVGPERWRGRAGCRGAGGSL